MGKKDRHYKLLTIPRRRRRDKVWTVFYIVCVFSYLLGLSLFILFYFSTKEEKWDRAAFHGTHLMYILLCIYLGEMLARFGLLLSEQRYVSTRYNGQSLKLCRKVYFQYGLRFWIVIMTSVTILVAINLGYKKENYALHVLKTQWFLYLTWIVMRGTLIPLFCFDGLTPAQASIVPDSNVVNCGQGLAWNYYLDYLQVILADIPDRISNTEWWHANKGKIVAKLFLLMPEDCFTYPNLSKADPLITFKGATKPIYTNRAGSVQRPHTNSIYGVENPEKGKLFYGAIEYAAPLQTLYEMSQCNDARITEGQMKEQMYIFYRTLSKILEKSPNGGNVVLLPYREKSPDGEKLELSKFLCSEIEEQYRIYGKEWIY